VLLARTLGATGYGIYAYAVSWALLLAIPATLGLPALLVREIAAYRLRGSWRSVAGLLLRADQLAGLAAATAALVVIGTTFLVPDGASPGLILALRWSAALIPLMALVRLRAAALRGLGAVVHSESVELTILPAALLGLLATAMGLGVPIDGFSAVGAHVIAAVIAVAAGTVLLRRATPEMPVRIHRCFDDHRWLRAVVPLGLLALTAGIYRIALSGAQVVTLAEAAIAALLAPRISTAHTAGDALELSRIVQRGVRATTVMTLPGGLALVIGGHWFLTNFFGADFSVGYPALAILVGAFVIRVLAGPGLLVLNMTGHDGDALRAYAGAAMLNVVLNAAFIPYFGATGAAAATMLAMTIRCVVVRHLVRVRLGFDPSVLAAWPQLPRRG
jgi:O-antigen/teichoic acid export membrane protein